MRPVVGTNGEPSLQSVPFGSFACRYKKNAFWTFDHTWVRKKTHQNKLDGWKRDGWILASGLSIYLCDFLWNMWIRWPSVAMLKLHNLHFHTSIFGFNALTLAKWGHTDSGGIPNGLLRKQGLAGNFIFPYFSHLCMSSSVPCTFALVHFAPKHLDRLDVLRKGTWTPWTHRSFRRAYHHHRFTTALHSPCKIILYFSGNAWTIVKWGEFFVAFISMGNSQWQLWVEIFARLSGPQRRVSMWNAMGRSVASNFMFRTCGFCHQNI